MAKSLQVIQFFWDLLEVQSSSIQVLSINPYLSVYNVVSMRAYLCLLLFCDTLKRNNMVVGTLIGGHLVLYLFSSAIRVSIYRYIKRKLPGLQSILDLLILDLIRVQASNYTFFIIILLIGFFHGEIPFVASQVMIFININLAVYLFSLYQGFLLIKATIIFKGFWLADISERTIVWTSRLFAMVWTSIRFLGDFLMQKSRAGPITKFLTGTNQES